MAKETKKKKKRERSNATDNFSGTAAEYFVAGELLRRGVNAFLSIGAHKQIDVLVKPKDGRICTIDVKAVHGRKPDPKRKTQASWNMPKVEARSATPHFFFVLVWLGSKRGDFAAPEFYVVPAAWAGERAAANHAAWAGEKATRDATSDMRRLTYSDVTPWRDRWDLVGVAAEPQRSPVTVPRTSDHAGTFTGGSP